MRPQAILFDLDGTLLDTAPDLAAALNRVRAEDGYAPLPYESIRPWVSHGSRALISAAYTTPLDAASFEARRLLLLAFYEAHIAEQTRLFEGMQEVLAVIEEKRLAWGIVTNKPGWLTTPLLRAMALAERAGCVISGDTLPQAKPHPAPLLAAASQLAVTPAACLYVGDAERDAEAANAAGMRCVIARYGYLGIDDDPSAWHAAGILDEPRDLLAWL